MMEWITTHRHAIAIAMGATGILAVVIVAIILMFTDPKHRR
jgi:hypothetical protein